MIELPYTGPRTALVNSRRVRILRYFDGGRFEVLLPDDSRRTVGREQLIFTKH